MVAHRELTAFVRGCVLTAVVVAAVTMFVADGAMAYVSGQNEFLEASQGRAFIPQKPQTSGILGETIGNNFIVGSRADTIYLSQGQTSQGSLTYDLFFDLSQDIQQGAEPVDINPADVDTESMALLLDLTDIDFAPVIGGGRVYSESIMLTVYDIGKTTKLSGGDGEGNVGTDYVSVTQELLATEGDLLIDALNYGEFRGGNYGATNNTSARYTVFLQDDLGLTLADFGQIFEQQGFILEVTITSTTTRTAPGVGGYRNTAEYLGDYSSNNDGFGDDGVPPNGLTFDIVPEPMTLSLLGLGSLALLRRRR